MERGGLDINKIYVKGKKYEILKIEKEEKTFPSRLLHIKKCPNRIYAVGNIKLLNNFGIAIVGSRKATRYGIEKAQEISTSLSMYGITIISGMAIGIDYYAHNGAMKENGGTIAVLGSGLGKIYPKENIELFNSILSNNGCIITEYEFNTEATSKNFPIRNRLISGMAVGTLIVEAMRRSGSMITARYSIEQDKKLFSLPNVVNVKQSEGVNELIRQGAILTRNSYDILQEYIPISNYEKNKKQHKNTIKKVPKEYQKLYEQITDIPINIEEIFYKNGMKNIAELTQILCMMEVENYIENIGGNCYIRRT